MEPGSLLVDWDYWLNSWPARPVALTRGNAADGYPAPLTPLSQDFVCTFEDAAVRRLYCETLAALDPSACPEPFIRAYYGLVYLTADQLGALGEAMPGASKRGVLSSFFGLDVDPAYHEAPPSAGDRVADARAAARVLPRVWRLAAGCEGRIASQLAALAEARAANPDRLTLEEASRWWDRLEAMSVDIWETLPLGAVLASAAFETVTKLLTRVVGADAPDLANRLHAGIGGNESADAARAVRELAHHAHRSSKLAAAIDSGATLEEVEPLDPGFASDFATVLERFGHRGPRELELACPSWRMNPDALLEAVRIELRRQGQEPPDGAAMRARAEAELADRAGVATRKLVRFLLGKSRALMSLRENAKNPVVQLADDLRRLTLAVGSQLEAAGAIDSADSMFFLLRDEVRSVLAGGDVPGAAELQRRRDDYLRCLQLDLPDFAAATSDGLRSLDDAYFLAQGMLPPPVREATGVLRGVAASSGVASGVPRVLVDPGGEFEPGDVLFAKTVDPGWAPVLGCAAAVVLDSGGVMSHGAVVARELGIPCVANVRWGTTAAVGCRSATVNGTTGTVELIP